MARDAAWAVAAEVPRASRSVGSALGLCSCASASSRQILGVFHYLPLHLSEMGRRFGGRPGDCPVAEDISDRIVRLPFYYGLTEADQARVIEAVTESRGL